MGPIKFYVTIPLDEQWNTGFPTIVIKGADVPETLVSPSYLPKRIKILEPISFSHKWPTLMKRFFIECPGPVRKLSHEDYVALIHKLMPQRPLPKGNNNKITDISKSNL